MFGDTLKVFKLKCYTNQSIFSFKYMRTPLYSFLYILNVVGLTISQKDRRLQKAIPAAENLSNVSYNTGNFPAHSTSLSYC